MISPLNCRGWGRVSEGMIAAEDMVMARVVQWGVSKHRDGTDILIFAS